MAVGIQPRIFALEGPLQLRAPSVTSSAVTLQWDAVAGATQIEIFVGPEAAAIRQGALPGQKLISTLAGSATSITISNLAAGMSYFFHVKAATNAGSIEQNLYVKTGGGPRANLSNPLRNVEAASFHMLKLVLANPGTVYNGSTLNNNTGADWQGGTWTVKRRDGTTLTIANVYRDSRPVSQPDWKIPGGGQPAYSNNNTVDLDHAIFLEFNSKILTNIGDNEVLTISHSGTAATTLTNIIVPYSDRYIESPLIQVNQVGYNPNATSRWAYLSLWRGGTAAGALGYVPLAAMPSTVEMISEPSDPLIPRPLVKGGLPVSAKADLATPTIDGADSNGAETGTEVKQIDLASVPEAVGVRYRVRIPGLGISYPTMVSRAGVLKAFYVMARGLFLNRWGRDISNCAWTDWCGRPPDHKVIYTSDADPYISEQYMNPLDGHVPAGLPHIARALPSDFGNLFNAVTGFAGGHHDAGDFDLRRHHTEIAEYLMLGYEINPSNFTDGQLDIPESGNGIPDMLDEAFWNIRSWIYLQDDDGSVRAGAEAPAHPHDYYYADTDPLEYWTWKKDADITMRAAGLFAQCARLLTPYTGVSSQAAIIVPALKARALKAWASPTVSLVVDGNGNFVSSKAGPGSTILAAGELLLLTGDAKYKKVFESVMAQRFYKNWDAIPGPSAGDELFTQDRFVNFPEYGPTPSNPDGQFSHTINYYAAYAKSPLADANYKALINAWSVRMADNDINHFDTFHAHRSAYRGYDWGGTSLPFQELANVFGALRMGVGDKSKYMNALSESLDHILGGNPANMSWTTGLGYFSPMEPAHLDSLSFIKDKGMPPMPGLPVFGPVKDKPLVYYNNEPLAGYFPDFGVRPKLLMWGDTRTLIVTNEVGSTMAAMNACLTGVLLSPDATTVPDSWRPGKPSHRNTLPDTDSQIISPPMISHPADTNGDFTLVINEVTKYSACWKNPSAFADCPTDAAIDYAVRAGTLWSASPTGQYKYNANQTCPLCWEVKP